MHQLRGLAVIFFFLSAAFAGAQNTGKLEWVVPFTSNFTLVGHPAADAYAYKSKRELYLTALGGQPRLLTYDSITFLTGDLWTVWQNQLKGVYSLKKGEVLPPVYEHLSAAAASGACWAFAIGKYGMKAVVNDRNQLLLPWRGVDYMELKCLNDSILEFMDHRDYQATQWGYVSRQGARLPPGAGERQSLGAFRRIAKDKFVFAYLRKGQALADTFSSAANFTHGIAPAKKDSLFGYWNQNGGWHIPPRFQAAAAFDTGGHAVVREKGLYGILRTDGSWAVPPRYDDLKALNPVFYQFKAGSQTGLTDSAGRILLPAGQYTELLASGTGSFGVRVADTIQIYNADGVLLPVAGIVAYEGKGRHFLAKRKIQDNKGKKVEVWGIGISDSGQWLIPPVLRGRVRFSPLFMVVETKSIEPFEVAGIKIAGDQSGAALIFNRDGRLLLPEPVGTDINSPYNGYYPCMYFKRKSDTGLVSAEGEILLSGPYSNIQFRGNGWIHVEQINRWALLKWKE